MRAPRIALHRVASAALVVGGVLAGMAGGVLFGLLRAPRAVPGAGR